MQAAVILLLVEAAPALAARSRTAFKAATADAIDVCGARALGGSGGGQELLEPVVTTRRGQKNTAQDPRKPTHQGDTGVYPYHLPQELTILCRNGSATLGQLRFVDEAGAEIVRPITAAERAGLFATLTRLYVRSPRRRTPAQDFNFVFVVDVDGNLLVAPVMQGVRPYEVKHGDLTPGQTPISRPIPQPGAWGNDVLGDRAFGAYRGLARLGGEFDLADESRQDWVMHQKSGYSLGRVTPRAVEAFKQSHAQMGEGDIWENLDSGCFGFGEILGIDAMERLRCYMISSLGVRMRARAASTCHIGSDAEAFDAQGNRPLLEKCVRADYAPVCGGGVQEAAGRPSMALVEWLPPATFGVCALTAEDMGASLHRLDGLFAVYETMHGDHEEGTPEEHEIVGEIRKTLRALKHTSCWRSHKFSRTARSGCPLTSCFGEPGMEDYFKGKRHISSIPMDGALAWWRGNGGVGILAFWDTRCRP